jgi:hydroxymethylglutaryl-CoA lyase
MGCYEVSLGDTLGVGTAADVHQLLTYLYCSGISAGSLACHFHDTYGQAVNNVWTAYQLGVRTFDSSVGGLGGCPFAPGAKGNVATEDLVYLFERAGINTGVELASLAQTGSWISEHLRKQNDSRAGAALVRKQAHPALNSKKDLKPKVKLLWQAQHGSDEVQIHYAKPNVKIVLNRPRNGNALTAEMILRLTKFFKAIRTDKTITRVVITANGKFFCTGMDLSKANSPVARNQNASTEQFSRLTELFEAIDNIPQVTIAAVNGPAFGGGVGLAFICDIRIFTSSATVTLSEVKLGLCPATISRYLMREWPTAFAREAMLTGRPIPAQQLLTLGLIAQIVDKNHTLADTIDEYLVQLRRAAPRASTLCKDLVKLSEVGGTSQMAGIRATFNEMMRVDSESAFGLMEFQAGKKDVDWDAYVLAKPKPKL